MQKTGFHDLRFADMETEVCIWVAGSFSPTFLASLDNHTW